MEPLSVLRARWKLLVAAGVVGGVAGIAGARFAPAKHEVQDVLLVGSVGGDPLHPGSRIPLQGPDEIVAWLKSGEHGEGIDIDAEQEGGWMVRLHVRSRDREAALKLCDELLARIEKDHRPIFEAWQTQTSLLQASLEKEPPPETTVALARAESDPLTGAQRASLVAMVRGPVYSRPTTRLAAPWVVRPNPRQGRAAIGGALASMALAWALAFALSVARAGTRA